jgi:hypothetical protein
VIISDGDLADPTNPTGGPEGAEANIKPQNKTEVFQNEL